MKKTALITNKYAQPVGESVEGWNGASDEFATLLDGRYCTVERLEPECHANGLTEAFSKELKGPIWTYMVFGEFEDEPAFRDWLHSIGNLDDPLYYVISRKSDSKPLGLASYTAIRPQLGCIELGNILFSSELRKTREATEAIKLMIQHAFDDLGYRRFEWKCDALNEPSRSAADRLGFSFDGFFPKALIYKGRNRDTAWYSIVDYAWPSIKRATDKWLLPDNFNDEGQQNRSLMSYHFQEE
ncbi:GNAT family N-acetyltransferase [bacterium]|nr:GNAT family N-acetyltransferase [bacterium]